MTQDWRPEQLTGGFVSTGTWASRTARETAERFSSERAPEHQVQRRPAAAAS